MTLLPDEDAIQYTERSEEADRLVAVLLGSRDTARGRAIEDLAERGISNTDLVSRAFARSLRHLEPHEMKLPELEVRRRRLREDYDRLKAARPRVVSDAEIVEGA